MTATPGPPEQPDGHDGSDGPDRPDVTPGGRHEADTPDAGVARSGRPDDVSSTGDGFDAVFQGEGWDSPRRRRRSSSSSSRTGSGSESSRSESSRSESGRRSSSSRGSSRRSSSSRRSGSTDRSRPTKTDRTSRHVRAVVIHVVLGLLGLGLAWIVVTGLLAAYQLNAARSDLSALRTQITTGGDRIGETADSLAAHAHHAAVLTRGPAWATAAAIPFVGDPFDAVRGITTETSALVDGAAPGLVAVAGEINPRTVVQAGVVDLPAVQRASGPVHTASDVAAAVSDRVADLPHSTWLPFVDSGTADLAAQLSTLDHTLRTTDQALQVLPTMLGGDGRARKYFVAFQNNAELRGTGGLPGAFAIVSAVDGKISIERFESDSALAGVIPTGLDFGKAYNDQYAGDMPYTQYIDSNESPHFPYAAQIWCAMWKNVSGEQLDGALTIDPGALSYLLAATGPATAPDGAQVTSDNVVALLQKDAYAKFPQREENDERRQYILGVASAVEKKILTGSKNNRALLQGLARGVSERRIVAWSSDPTVAAVLAQAPIGGTVATTDQPYSLLSLNNGAAGKLDYYLDRSVTWARTGCGDTRQVTVTITLTNNAPASGLPAYVTERQDANAANTVPGQNRLLVDYVATTGAMLGGVTLDGTAAGASIFEEVGHPVYRVDLELLPGQSRTIVLTLQEPAGDEPVTVVRQPGVRPIDVVVDDRSCR